MIMELIRSINLKCFRTFAILIILQIDVTFQTNSDIVFLCDFVMMITFYLPIQSIF